MRDGAWATRAKFVARARGWWGWARAHLEFKVQYRTQQKDIPGPREKKDLIHTLRSAMTVDGMLRNTCQVHFLNINVLSFLLFFFPIFFSSGKAPPHISTSFNKILHLDFLLTETFHPSPMQWVTWLCCRIDVVTQLSGSLPRWMNVQSSLERMNCLSRQRKFQGDSEPGHPDPDSFGNKWK